MMLFVIGGLDPDEQREMRAHIDRGCPTCAGAVAEAGAVVGWLALAPDPVEPPPGVARRLMARVEADLKAPSAPRRRRWRVPDALKTDWGRLLLVAVVASAITYLVISTPFTRSGQGWKDNYYEKVRESHEYHEQLEAARKEIKRLKAPPPAAPAPPGESRPQPAD
jgi:hypothetical protein